MGCLGGGESIPVGGGPATPGEVGGPIGGTAPGEVAATPDFQGTWASPERDPIFVSDIPDDYSCFSLDDKVISVQEFFACPELLSGSPQDQVVFDGNGLCHFKLWEIYWDPFPPPSVDCNILQDRYKGLRTFCLDTLATWCLRLRADRDLGLTYYSGEQSYALITKCCKNSSKEWCEPYKEGSNEEPPPIGDDEF